MTLESIQTLILTVLITAVVTVLAQWGVKLLMNYFGRGKKAITEERIAEIVAKSLNSKVIPELSDIKSNIDDVKTKLKEVQNDLELTKSGIQMELRHNIRNSCRRCINQGFRTEDDVSEVVGMHEKYEKLGQNGITNALYTEFEKLPMVSNDYKPTKESIKRTLNEDKRSKGE